MPEEGANSSTGNGRSGLQLKSTPNLLSLLQAASIELRLDEAVRAEAALLAQEEHLAWSRLKPIYQAICAQSGTGSLKAKEALKGSNLHIPETPTRERSPELVARLAKLQRAEDERKYNAMVADITGPERKAEAAKQGGLVTYKDQIGFGVHIFAVMGVFYALGHLAVSAMSPDRGLRAAGGLAGLIIAILMETILLMIRTSDHHLSPKYQKVLQDHNLTAGKSQKPRNVLEDRGQVEEIGSKKDR